MAYAIATIVLIVLMTAVLGPIGTFMASIIATIASIIINTILLVCVIFWVIITVIVRSFLPIRDPVLGYLCSAVIALIIIIII